jgi:Repeat of unknown function (DUF5648)
VNQERYSVRRLATLLVGVVAVVASGLAVVSPTAANAITGSQFNPGYIISDANFFNYNSMSAASIEQFLQGQEAGCTAAAGQPCLANYTTTTTSRAAAPNGCAAYTGATNEAASTIIWRVAQACRISPEVLLVTLQKEEGLVTSRAPSAGAYRIAMGYGCPDTAPCDAEFFGFYNQVYKAAWQFRQYTYIPTGRRYHVGNVAVQYSPNVNCGAPTVNVLDQATANLYLYTPYQPNVAALNNLNGSGDGCSSYGNRNFWVYYWNWFGDPTGSSQPFGNLDTVSETNGGYSFSGWAIDPDTTAAITVKITVDGTVFYTGLANKSRPDIGVVYPDKGANHGFSGTITGVSDALHTVCVTGVNVSFGSDAQIQCLKVGPPIASAPAGETVVYRFYEPSSNDHFFTSSLAERNSIIANFPPSTWTYEGVAFDAFTTQVPGSVPLYRFWSPQYVGHFFTAVQSEKDSVIANFPASTWTYEGVAFYVYPANSTAAKAESVYRFWSPTFHQHFYTASAGEQAEIVATDAPSEWTYEGVNFKVPTN